MFRIDPAKVPTAGVQARCFVCGAVFAVAPVPSAIDVAAFASPAQVDESVAEVGVGDDSAAAGSREADGPSPPIATDRPGREIARPAPSAEPVVVRPPELAAVSPSASPAAPRARPVNPFLNNTPELRARRLARALVSDLVAYNPQKREEGLRDGTLRQLFRDEIRKSWDEYVEQVGATVAESTPHFQDALNDVLAGGRRVF